MNTTTPPDYRRHDTYGELHPEPESGEPVTAVITEHQAGHDVVVTYEHVTATGGPQWIISHVESDVCVREHGVECSCGESFANKAIAWHHAETHHRHNQQ